MLSCTKRYIPIWDFSHSETNNIRKNAKPKNEEKKKETIVYKNSPYLQCNIRKGTQYYSTKFSK